MPGVSGVCASSVCNSEDALLETVIVSLTQSQFPTRYQTARRQQILANTRGIADTQGTRHTRDHADLRGT